MKTNSHLHVVVIAGGSGTRFWPLSRRSRPKQLLDLGGQGSLLSGTFDRVVSLVGASRCWMVVGASHAGGCREAAPQVTAAQVLVEPRGRNTAPAIALAALHLRRADAHAVMAVLPADHHVAKRRAFCAALVTAAEAASRGAIVTLGIAPTRPETGYGYIQRGSSSAAQHGDAQHGGVFDVQRFREKPSAEKARAFLAAGGFDWNAGIFVVSPAVYLEEVARQLPELHTAMVRLESTIGTPEYPSCLAETYDSIESISIDYGIMENARNVKVVPVDCGWSDVGSWDALGAVVPADDAGNNVVAGRAVLIDSQDCIVSATRGHVVGVVGMRGVVVVHTPDATLVVPAERAQEVRDILATVEKRGWTELL